MSDRKLESNDYAMTWQEIGEELGVSWQYAHRIGLRALAKLRRTIRRERKFGCSTCGERCEDCQCVGVWV